MPRLFTNGPSGDFVCNPFEQHLSTASNIHLAAPYFTHARDIVAAARRGATVQLLIGLNTVTSPAALKAVMNVPGLAVRYLTHRFHAKIFIFDDRVLLGSSNLTDGGLRANREAVVHLGTDHYPDSVEEVRSLFLELWESAASLTDTTFAAFDLAWHSTQRVLIDHDASIEEAVGRVEPANISVQSRGKSRDRIFLDELNRLVLEKYRPAFSEVTRSLVDHNHRRSDLAEISKDNETNRFLSWVRQTKAAGEEAWLAAALRPPHDRATLLTALGEEWSRTDDNKVPDVYLDWLTTVHRTFGAPGSLGAADRDAITEGLMSLHAFEAQGRFTKGGVDNLPAAFWKQNKEDTERVRTTIQHLLFGAGHFVERLHDVVYSPKFKLQLFGKFCALELYGTVKPEECPPMNGRMAKGLRFLGFDVPPNG